MPRLFQRLTEVSMRKRRTSIASQSTHRRTPIGPSLQNESPSTVPNGGDNPDNRQPNGEEAVLSPCILSTPDILSGKLPAEVAANKAVTGSNAQRVAHGIGRSLRQPAHITADIQPS